jgi:hypothetical protein
MERLQTLRQVDKPKMKKTLYRKTHRHWDNPNVEMTSWVVYYFHIWTRLKFGWIGRLSQSGSEPEQPDLNWDGIRFGT